MHREVSKRRKRTQLALIYGMMTIAVIATVGILVLVMQGYRFNKYDGRIEQGGLVQFDSRPGGAKIEIDAVALANRTQTKITATAGTHTFTISKPGYTTWKKDDTVVPGTILWLNYARLFPTTPVIQDVAQLPGIDSSLVSPNHDYIVLLSLASEPTLQIIKTNDTAPVLNKIAWPTDIFTAASDVTTQKFTLQSWDNDNRYVLVRHEFDGKTEYISLDTRGNDHRNISVRLGVYALSIAYQVGHNDQFYILTSAHELRRGNTGNNTLSGPIIANVQDFSQADDSVLSYTTLPDPTTKKRAVGYYTNGANNGRVLYEYDEQAGTPTIKIGKYYGDRYIVVGTKKTASIVTGDLPPSDAKAAAKLTDVAKFDMAVPALYVGFAPGENRFAYAQSGNKFAVYDLEWKKLAHHTFTATPTREIEWEDSFHVLNTAEGSLYHADFDGLNGYSVAKDVVDKPAALSNDSKYLYYYVKNGEQTKLVRQKLIVE